MGRALGVVADGAGAALGTAAHAHSGQTDAAVRSDLVAAHKLLAMHGFDELTWNHISSRVGPQHDDASVFLITPGTKMYMDINRADLCLVDESRRSQSDQVTNETGDIIHSAVYSARKDVCAIVHTHIPAVVAVACLKEGLMCVDQSSAPFYKNVAYYDWQGVSTDTNERMDIAKVRGLRRRRDDIDDAQPRGMHLRRYRRRSLGAHVLPGACLQAPSRAHEMWRRDQHP